MHLVKEALRAQAVAEAMGEKFEFRKNISEAEVLFHINNDFKSLYITDDTQMTLFGMEAQTEIMTKASGLGLDKEIHIKHLVEWRNTQDAGTHTDENQTWLGKMKCMQYAMAPGATCLSALADIRDGRKFTNNSNGCGTVMKALPFALGVLDGRSALGMTDLAIEVSKATHQSPITPFIMRTYMQVAYALMLEGCSVHMKQIAQRGTHINQWGGGWNASDCLNMACWAVGNAEDYEDLMVLSIAHDGDSDSVAAVAGALWALAGLPLGRCHKLFLERLEEASLVDAVADRFIAGLALNR